MGLLDGGLANVFSAALSGLYLDAALYRRNDTPDGKGGGARGFLPSEPVKAQLDQTRQAPHEGAVDTEQRILVLAAGIDPITTDDEIEVGGIRWAISHVATDPAQAYYDLRGRTSGRGPGS